MAKENALSEPREDIPMAAVSRQCATAGVSTRLWAQCQRVVGSDFAPLKMSPPRTMKTGPELVVSSFAEAAKAKCERRKPSADMIPFSRSAKVCQTTGVEPRCSELTFTEEGPAVRLCSRGPGEPGPLVQVKTAQGATDVATKFCSRRVVPRDAPIGEFTLEFPDGTTGTSDEEEEIS